MRKNLIVLLVIVVLLVFSTASFVYATPVFGSRTLSYGLWGNDVATLQKFLNQHSYHIGTATGYFGSVTQQAVKNFQKDHSLTPDGVVGKLTFGIITKIMNNYVLYTVQPGDTLYLISKKFNTTVTDIQKANNLTGSTIIPGQKLNIPKPVQPTQPPGNTSYILYKVVPGDTLYLIAQKYKTTVTNIKKANNLTSDTINVGQQLKIPKPATQPPVTQPPVTQPPVTQPPVTQPPVTQPPVTQPPVTQPPVTQPPVTEPPVIAPATYAEVVVNKDSANILDKADPSGNVIISMVKGTRLAVASASDTWYQVRLYNGTLGWISSEDVTGKDASTNPVRSVLGFYTDYEAGLGSSYNTLLSQADNLTSIAPFWFRINRNDSATLDPVGNFTESNARKVVSDSHQRNIKVLAVINNLMYGTDDISRQVMKNLLATPDSRKQFIDNVMILMQDYGLDGVNIDTEYINVSDRDNFSTLLKELKTAFNDKGYILTVSVPGKMSDDPNNSWNGAFDYAAIGQYVDQVVVMLYLEHGYPGSGPGPISSVGFDDNIMQFATKMIPAEKIIAALPVFGADFTEDGSDNSSLYISYSQAMQKATTNNATIVFDDVSKTPMFKYTDASGRQREVWFENADSMSYKMDVINKWNVAGVGIWRMGMEDPNAWGVISQKAAVQK